MSFIQKKIVQGVTLLSVNANRFKTNEIAISLALPLKKETASVNALLINLLSRKSREYPSLTNLNKRLAFLYGASLSAVVSKVGESQVLKLGITSLDDKFSLDGESISLECVKLLTSLLFEPRLDDNGKFFDEDIEAEKRILIEKIESEQNEKRVYVLRQAEALMFAGEPYAIGRYGTVDDVKKITADDVLNAWKNALETALIMVTVVGSADTDTAAKHLKEKFSSVKRNYTKLPDAVFVPSCDEVKEKMERIDVKQGKLVLGFRVNLKPDDELTPAMRTFCDIFGGGPYSKLFANVREKLSLCYYCSARYTRLKSCIMIQCGCNEENMDKAVSEIMHQLDEIKNGNFEEEFNSSKIGLRDAIMSVNDAPEVIEGWYANQLTSDEIKTPKQSADENDAVTMEDVKKCASLLTLDTIYKLSAPKEAE
ncbi:MAG: insulinase family protein [Eubacterium sp.]|nr:insulinase family protein [Eubacterium sp.]